MSHKIPVSAIIVADYFIDKAQKEGRPISNKKLQKLLYYSQAWHLALRNKKLFSEKIEAWVHGPAIRKIYVRFKEFGFNPITKEIDKSIIKNIPNAVKTFLDDVWSVYGKLDAPYLEALSHTEEPWLEARAGLPDYANSENEISLKTMKRFFSQKLKNVA